MQIGTYQEGIGMTPAPVIRWRGGPGAGKSSALIDYVRAEAGTGATIGDIVALTFSRSQAADLARRLHAAVFPAANVPAVRGLCTTIHACALRQCLAAGLIENPRVQVIQPGDRRAAPIYQDFMGRHGLAFDPAIGFEGDDDDQTRSDLPIGNQVIALAAYLTATRRPPAAWREAAAALGLSVPGHAWPIEDLLCAWATYKRDRAFYEHEDYVRLALDHDLPPPAPILFIDEYQDVSPAQDALIRQWISHPDTRRVYVAGDADQSIYGFRGCDPALFLDLAAEDRGATGPESRPVSHRCPVEIMAIAETILSRPATVSPCDRPGQVHHVRPTTAAGLAAQVEETIRYARTLPGNRQPVFILSRYRRAAGNLAHALAAAGIPCTSIKPSRVRFWTATRIGRDRGHLEPTTISPWTLKRAIAHALAGSDIDQIPTTEAEAVILSTLTDQRRAAALTDLRIRAKRGPIRLGDVYALVGARGDQIFDALNLRPWIVAQIRACLARERQRGYEITPDMVKIDTIHASKGLESSIVLLHTGYLRGRLPALADPDRLAEERRVYFVGATRAADALLLLDYGDGPTCPILAGVVA
ncbi:UvrD/REP helicase [Methanofollis liminatans DSM 4140]|uniref:DNA 3'-5' helicase n=1 Tax=Methanofollis liminatans DSM 4140 TaxID=28892 RepID=J0S8R2_9EURY|nr:UvrD-helicase domain-containing protein [Methanofollis liminatans]EJG06989.1 UvrD/REP helicase [Methanofollis liminatans DSM 4140]